MESRVTATTEELSDHLQERVSFHKGQESVDGTEEKLFSRAKQEKSKMPARFPQEMIDQAKTDHKLIDLVEYPKNKRMARHGHAYAPCLHYGVANHSGADA